jgi:hypothetical protein
MALREERVEGSVAGVLRHAVTNWAIWFGGCEMTLQGAENVRDTDKKSRQGMTVYQGLMMAAGVQLIHSCRRDMAVETRRSCMHDPRCQFIVLHDIVGRMAGRQLGSR